MATGLVVNGSLRKIFCVKMGSSREMGGVQIIYINLEKS